MRSNMNQHFIQKALPQAKWVWDRLLGTPGFWSILSSVIMATVASCDPKTSEITAPAPHQTRQLVPEISACGKMYPKKHMENVCQAHGCYHSFHHWKGVMLDNISKLTSWINSPQCSFVYIGNNMETTYFQHRPSNLFQMFPKKQLSEAKASVAVVSAVESCTPKPGMQSSGSKSMASMIEKYWEWWALGSYSRLSRDQ